MNTPTEQLLRVQNFMLSTDGYGTGEGQSIERPFGHADPAALASWAGATASWPNRTEPGGSRGLDDYFTRDYTNNIGAEIMGRGKFGPQKGPWEDLEWQGWWGDNPPFHTPVFVLTHYERPSISLSDTTFHFIDAEPMDALAQAKAAAAGKDVRLGGGVSTVREFLEADLVDTMHVAVAPVEIGRGGRLWESPDDLLDRFHRESIPSPAVSSTTCSGAGSSQFQGRSRAPDSIARCPRRRGATRPASARGRGEVRQTLHAVVC